MCAAAAPAASSEEAYSQLRASVRRACSPAARAFAASSSSSAAPVCVLRLFQCVWHCAKIGGTLSILRLHSVNMCGVVPVLVAFCQHLWYLLDLCGMVPTFMAFCKDVDIVPILVASY